VTDRRVPRRRDPEGRRRAIVAATVEVMAEHGLSRVSHRLVADRADVPLGSTTYYFPALSDLVSAAVEQLARSYATEMQEWGRRLASSKQPRTALVQLAADYLADRARAIVEIELYVAAAREPALRPPAEMWIAQLQEILEPVTGPVRARAVSMLLDGAMLRAVVSGAELDVEALDHALRSVLEPA
jgi:DNA-binding transcriptional regulator YbjK